MILRAMAKDPAKRHGSAAAFRYELNTVMDMLDMGRRRSATGTLKPEVTREAVIVAAFDRSRIPQALLSLDGVIVYSNKAFLRLLGQDTPVEGLDVKQTTLHTVLPGLQRAMRTAHSDGKPCERRARVFRGNDQPSLELSVWLSPLPLPGTEIHMMIRVEESDGRRRDE